MPLHLTIENETSLPDGGPVSISVNTRRGIDIGRDQYLDWVLPDPTRFISGKHCEVRYRDGHYWLQDVSTNGTYINGSEYRPDGPHPLRSGDRLEIGRYLIAVVVEPDAEEMAQPGRMEGGQQPAGGLWDLDGPAAPAINPQELRVSSISRGLSGPDPLDWVSDVPTPPTLPDSGWDWTPPPPARNTVPPAEPPAAPFSPAPPTFADTSGAQLAGSPGAPIDERALPQATLPPLGAPMVPAPQPAGLPPAQAAPFPEAPFPEAPLATTAFAPQPQQPPAAPFAAAQAPVAAAPFAPATMQPAMEAMPAGVSPAGIAPMAATPVPVTPPAAMPAAAAGPVPTPVMPPAPYPAMPAQEAGAAAEGFRHAFARGAGIDPSAIASHSDEALAEMVGLFVRLTADNLRQLHIARAQSKGAMRSSNMTMIQAIDNNPLRFSPTTEDALRILLGPPTTSYLGANKALESSFGDLKRHQVAVFAAMQQALSELTADLDPDHIEASMEDGKGVGSLLRSRQARHWEHYRTVWKAKVGKSEHGMLDVFMRLFSSAYDKSG